MIMIYIAEFQLSEKQDETISASVLCIYVGSHIFWSSLARLPACHSSFNQCDNSPVVRLIKWIHQEHYYVGCGMYEATTDYDYILYMLFWLVVLVMLVALNWKVELLMLL